MLKFSARRPIDGWIYLRCIECCLSRLKSGIIQICLQCSCRVNTRAALWVTWSVAEIAPTDWPITKVTQNQQRCIDAVVCPTDVKCLVRRTERLLCYHQQQRKSTWKFYAYNERIKASHAIQRVSVLRLQKCPTCYDNNVLLCVY
jgi:hypothetical protein